MKTFFYFLALFGFTTSASSQEAIELQTEIIQATVFTQGAQIFRTGAAIVPSGRSKIQITSLTPDMDPKSIQVKVSDGITILSISHQLNHLSAAHKNKSMDSLSLIGNQLELRQRTLRSRLIVINEKLDVLHENKDLSSAGGGISIDQLEKALILFEMTHMEAENERITIGVKLDSIDRARNLVSQKLLELRGTPVLSKSEISLVIKSESKVSAQFEISYVVKSAGWFSRYDIRAKDISKPVQLVYKTDVFQRTGEVWKNIKLKFSNGSPYDRQTVPELAAWNLNYVRNTVFRRIGVSDLSYGNKMLTGKVRDENGDPLIFANVIVDGHNLGTQTDLDGNFSLLLPADAESVNVNYTGYENKNVRITGSNMEIKLESGKVLDEVSVISKGAYSLSTITGFSQNHKIKQEIQPTIVIENQIIIEFELEHPATILSDGKITNLELLTYDMEASYLYEAVPKADPGAYLIAILNDWEKYHLSEGEANLFFNNTYIGKTILNPDMMSDTLELSLGRDPEIIIERRKVDEFSKKNFLGSTTIAERSFKISVRNKKLYQVNIQLSDQIPVSVNEAITVTETGLSGGNLDDSTGIVTWNISLAPGESKDLFLNYSVKYPSKERVALE